MIEINKIYNEDCFDLMLDIENNSIDGIITDPPFGVTALAWDIRPDLDKMFSEFNRVIKPDGQIIIFSQQPFTTDLINANRKNFKYDLIWDKVRPVGMFTANKKPMRQHENILIFNKRAKYNNIKNYKKNTIGMMSKKCKNKISTISSYYNTERKFSENNCKYGNVRTIFRYLINNLTRDKSGLHPTQKPLLLIKDLVRMYSDENDLILDPFSGSGVLAVAAYGTKRNFICIEKEKGYYDVSVKRYEQVSKQLLLV